MSILGLLSSVYCIITPMNSALTSPEHRYIILFEMYF